MDGGRHGVPYRCMLVSPPWHGYSHRIRQDQRGGMDKWRASWWCAGSGLWRTDLEEKEKGWLTYRLVEEASLPRLLWI